MLITPQNSLSVSVGISAARAARVGAMQYMPTALLKDSMPAGLAELQTVPTMRQSDEDADGDLIIYSRFLQYGTSFKDSSKYSTVDCTVL